MMTTISTIPSREWSLPRNHLKVDLRKFQDKSVATIAAISGENGVDFTMHFPRSVNQERFI
jgi:hypothetical protein